MLSQRQLNDLYTEMEMEIRDLSESLIAELALRDELEYEKELKNQFISLLLSIQNKKRHLGSNASHHRRTQKNGDRHAETKSNGNTPMKFRGTNEPKVLHRNLFSPEKFLSPSSVQSLKLFYFNTVESRLKFVTYIIFFLQCAP